MRTASVRSVLVCLVICGAAAAKRPDKSPDPPDRRERLSWIQGPGLGLVFEERTGSLRPVLGIPGAARLGEPIDIGARLARAVVSPRQDAAIGVTAEGAAIGIRLSPAGAVTQDLGAASGPIAFSDDGGAAAIAGGGITLWRTGESFEPAGRVDIEGEITALALSGDGALLAALANGAVQLLEPGQPPVTVGSVRHASAAAFVPGSRDAIVTDDAGDIVYLLRSGAFFAIADQAAGVAGPVAAAVSSGRALVANAKTGAVLSIRLSDGAAETSDCGCRPSRLDPTLENGVFWLADGLVFDDQPAGRRVWFVPAGEGGRR